MPEVRQEIPFFIFLFFNFTPFWGKKTQKKGETKLKKAVIFGNFAITENKIKRRAFYF